MSTGLGALRADYVGAGRARLVHVLRMPDHVHVQDAVGVQLVDDVFGRHAHGRHEQLCAPGDDDVDEFVERASGVVELEESVDEREV